MADTLKKVVYDANLLLPKYGLVTFTWGNVSGIDRASGEIIIKPSGVPYEGMCEDNMVTLTLDGSVKNSRWKPSSDTPTHLELYRAFPEIGGIVHTHSRWATVFAQAGMAIPAMGTTHADYFHGAIPCTRPMRANEIGGEYEKETGTVIIEAFRSLDPNGIPAVVVYGHGPFVWGRDPMEAVHNAVVLEEAAFMAWHAMMLNPDAGSISKELLDKHFCRKHGANAYYGQGK